MAMGRSNATINPAYWSAPAVLEHPGAGPRRIPLASTDPTVPVTAACELGDCHRCRGTVFSVTASHGRPCQHPCHAGDDRAVEARLEAAHFGEVA
jgi:hypothetical protein